MDKNEITASLIAISFDSIPAAAASFINPLHAQVVPTSVKLQHYTHKINDFFLSQISIRFLLFYTYLNELNIMRNK